MPATFFVKPEISLLISDISGGVFCEQDTSINKCLNLKDIQNENKY